MDLRICDKDKLEYFLEKAGEDVVVAKDKAMKKDAGAAFDMMNKVLERLIDITGVLMNAPRYTGDPVPTSGTVELRNEDASHEVKFYITNFVGEHRLAVRCDGRELVLDGYNLAPALKTLVDLMESENGTNAKIGLSCLTAKGETK